MTFNLSQIMKQAWTIRKEYAAKINCPVGEVLMGECLRMAWSQAKAQDTMTSEQVATEIKKVKNVIATNRWTKGGKDRLYIEFRSQNRFAAVIGPAAVYVDLTSNVLVVDGVSKKTCAGAETYRNVCDAIDEIRQILAA